MPKRHQLGELQLEIMRVLWRLRGASVREVHQELDPSRELVPSTVGTMLSKMETKGVVRHLVDGRAYIYLPTVTEADVQRSMVADLCSKLFGGDSRALMGHLVRTQELDGSDLDALRAEIDARESEEGV